MQASLAMVPTRVNGRGSLVMDCSAVLARTLAQEAGYILVLRVLRQDPDPIYNHGIPVFTCSFCLSVRQPAPDRRLL